MTIKQVNNISIDRGAPNPMIICKNNVIFLTFYNQEEKNELHERDERFDKNISLIKFSSVLKHTFGSPNQDMLFFHEYSKLGIKSGEAYLIQNSEWIKKEIEFARQHPYFNSKKFDRSQHFLFVFKDNLFECIAESLDIQVIKENTQTEEIFNLFLYNL